MVDLEQKRFVTPEADAAFGWRVVTVFVRLVGRLYWLVLVRLPGLVNLTFGSVLRLVLVLGLPVMLTKV
jgi:hypothetical protein